MAIDRKDFLTRQAAAQARYRTKNREKVLARERIRRSTQTSEGLAFLAKKRRDERRRLDAQSPEAREARLAKNRKSQQARYWRDLEKSREKSRLKKRRLDGIPEPTRPEPDSCECCDKPRGNASLIPDHDHVTNEFRGWVCKRCNWTLGILGDQYELISARTSQLLRYLT